MTTRLDTVSPDLAKSFEKADPATRRQAVAAACALVTSRIGLNDADVMTAIDSLLSGNRIDHTLRQKMEALSAEFDDRYLALADDADETSRNLALGFFSKARAISAVAFALSDNLSELHEALYEAISALDDPTEVISMLAKLCADNKTR